MSRNLGRARVALDVLTTIAMLAASAAVLWVTFAKRSVPKPAAPPVSAISPSTPIGYAIGDQAPDLQVDWRASPSTAVLYVASTCRYCTESMAFYRQLAAMPRAARIVAVGVEPKEVLQRYLDSHGVRADAVVSVDRAGVRFKGTPTLMLVSNDGVVRAGWIGRLGPPGEREVVDAIR